MVTVFFEAHGTTLDNEAGLSSGSYDVELSELGQRQAVELGERYKDVHLDAVFCSDQRRSYNTAEIAFSGREISIFKDKRLRECDYGDLTRHPESETKPLRGTFVTKPFPGGESYQDTTKRVGEFLTDLLTGWEGKTVLIIDHRATQYALDHFVNGLSVYDAVVAPWQWQPGWTYHLEKVV